MGLGVGVAQHARPAARPPSRKPSGGADLPPGAGDREVIRFCFKHDNLML